MIGALSISLARSLTESRTWSQKLVKRYRLAL